MSNLFVVKLNTEDEFGVFRNAREKLGFQFAKVYSHAQKSHIWSIRRKSCFPFWVN